MKDNVKSILKNGMVMWMTDITIDDIAEYMYRGDKEIFDSCVERVKKRGYNQQQAESFAIICLQILSHSKIGDME